METVTATADYWTSTEKSGYGMRLMLYYLDGGYDDDDWVSNAKNGKYNVRPVLSE